LDRTQPLFPFGKKLTSKWYQIFETNNIREKTKIPNSANPEIIIAWKCSEK
jgi:hypothetical protein